MSRQSQFAASLFFIIFSLPISFGYSETNSVSLYIEASKLENSGDYIKAADIISKLLSEEKSAHLYSKLVELFISAGEDEKAIESLKKAEQAFPSDPYFKFLLGQLYEFYKKNPESALKYYMGAAGLSNDPKYLLSASRAAEGAGDYKTAVEIMNKIVKQNPNVSDFYADRGRILQKLKQIDKSIEDLKKAVELDSNMPAMLRLADIYLSRNDNASAKKLLEKIAEQKGDFIIPELKLGDIYKNEKDYAKAIELYSSVAGKLQGKDRANVLKQLGLLQYETGDIDNATISLQWVTELVPDDTAGAFLAGYIYESQKKYDEASKIYENALKYNPKYTQLLKRMAAINILRNNGDEALKYLKNIDSLEYDVDYYLLLSESHSIKKDHNKAAIALIDGLNENPTDTTILYGLAMQYEFLKERDKAEEVLKKALSIQPENPILLNFLGYLYADMGINLDEAQKMVGKALEKEPENPAYLDSMGWVYYKQKKNKKAFEYIEKAYKLMPDDPEIKIHFEEIKKTIK